MSRPCIKCGAMGVVFRPLRTVCLECERKDSRERARRMAAIDPVGVSEKRKKRYRDNKEREKAVQLAMACHFTNLRPLWAKENLTKGAKYEF